jgi:hypothetical protein
VEGEKTTIKVAVAAIAFAQAFDRWKTLDTQLAKNPTSVRPETISAAWTEVMQAHEEWSNSR